MPKKKAKDLTPKKAKKVKGGVMDRDVDRVAGRDVTRIKKGIQKTGQGLGDDIRAVPK